MSRKFIVSGASRGIGLATAQALLKTGHSVVGISRSESPLPSSPDFSSVILDLTNTAEISRIMKVLLQQHPDISGLINNAGSGLFGSLEEFSIEQIQTSIQLNLISSIHLTRCVVSTLKQQHRSDIIFIGSESALQGARYGSIYCAAKFGIRGFAQSLRHECANRNTHVCLINPGMVRSHFFDELAFEPGPAEENAIATEDIATAVISVVNSADNAVVEEININPSKHVVRKKP